MSQLLFTVKNDDEGKTLVKLLRKQLRNTPRAIRVRGRGYRYGKRSWWTTLPLGMSQKLAVYLYDKPQTEFVKVVDLTAPSGVRWVSQPTKWHPSRRGKK